MKRSTIASIVAFVTLVGATLTVVEQWHNIEPWLIPHPESRRAGEIYMHFRTLVSDGDYAQALALTDDTAREQSRRRILQNSKKYEMFGGIRISPKMSDLELFKAHFSVFPIGPAKVSAVKIDGDIATLTVVETESKGGQAESIVKMKRNGDAWLIHGEGQ